MGPLQLALGEQQAAKLLNVGSTSEGHGNLGCPKCTQPMTRAVATLKTGEELTLKVCRPCGLVWFEPIEYQFTPLPSLAQNHPQQTVDDINAKSFIEAQKMIQMEKKENPEFYEDWRTVPGYLGLPVELEPSPGKGGAVVATWFVAFAITCIGMAALSNLEGMVQEYGLIPQEAGRYYGLTFITSFFLHASVWHLVANVYFLVLFGRRVERDLGSGRWALLLFAAAFAGDLIDIVFDPRGFLPVIGASGGISGILAYYVLKFPNAELQMPVRPMIRPLWFEVPAWVFLVGWIVLQIGGALDQMSGKGHIASLSHLGGLAVGLVFWLFEKDGKITRPSQG